MGLWLARRWDRWMLGGFEGGGFDLFILMIPGCIFFCLSVGWEKAE
jgi:hypothetical protein